MIQTVKNPPDWQARSGALSGLGKIRGQTATVVPVITAYLDDDNSVVERSAAYALLNLDNQLAYQALLQATNNPNIGDIVEQARKITHQPQLP